MASIRFVALLAVLIIASSVSDYVTGVGAQEFKEECTESCCSHINCDEACTGKISLCKPEETCNGNGGLCCCAS
ncbi:hypothetical protein Hanom_Chr01g00036441 [Helianthus anomalus]